MKSKTKYLLLAILFLSFLIGGVARAEAPSVKIDNFSITPKSISKASTLNYSINLSEPDANAINNQCGGSGNSLYWFIYELNSSQTVATQNVANGKIPSDEFLANLKVSRNGTFGFTPLASQTSANFQLTVYCLSSFGGAGKQITQSAVEKVDVISTQAGVVKLDFGSDKTNQTVPAGSDLKISFNLSATAKEADLRGQCTGDTLVLSIYQVTLTNATSRTNAVFNNGVSFSSFGTGVTIPQSIPLTIKVPNQDFGFVAQARCNGTKVLAESSLLRLNVSGSGGATKKYDCKQNRCVEDPNGKYIDPKCSNKCSSISGNGASQSFPFEITNPLAGGADTLFDLVNVIITWIFNISIPIAVILILWAGFLMLTAGAKPANWQKGKDILWYVVVGLAVIFIGKGFVTLIISIIKLGGPGS